MVKIKLFDNREGDLKCTEIIPYTPVDDCFIVILPNGEKIETDFPSTYIDKFFKEKYDNHVSDNLMWRVIQSRKEWDKMWDKGEEED